ncbi:uncharacterized protein K444DRAFT_635401 [Hyaloscypha bicolor E]|uniref:Uncharacterized protein n=1 Tax=Hyaloscypha bicolor E TaxID=1095630 RepID=A0A2J6SRF7_9HELO|nr:uncharacterized protein K444DRAFT_635401 [Hyaloscypha bicolor E]PMD53368.1 hypothetical protein K444DRAFT_635401 [Hyaloscypha bicolor E]
MPATDVWTIAWGGGTPNFRNSKGSRPTDLAYTRHLQSHTSQEISLMTENTTSAGQQPASQHEIFHRPNYMKRPHSIIKVSNFATRKAMEDNENVVDERVDSTRTAFGLW